MQFIGLYHPKDPEALADARGSCPGPERGFLLRAEDVWEAPDLTAFSAGRLRNTPALARALALPEGASPAAIAAAAYRRWGTAYARHLEGPVITGVYDARQDALTLSRDRMGELPCFYCRCGGGFAFASHPDALLRAGLLRPVVDAAGLGELFALGPARTPGRTPYRDLLSLEPGALLTVRGGNLEVERYYSLPVHPHAEDETETIRRVRVLVEQAVADILPLRPAAMLSGGIDSTALTALLAASGETVRTFSVDYAQNERYFAASEFLPELDAPYVTLAAEALGTDHMRVLLSQQALAAALDEAANARGFPGMADIDSSLLLFSREIASYARCAVSGECGDEVFGGYPWFKNPSLLREDAFPWSGSLKLREAVLRPELRQVVNPAEYVHNALAEALAQAETLPGEGADEARLRRMQQLCFRFFMANLQERAFCMGNACGLEVLTPFSDERLVEYVFNVPWRLKFLGGQEKGLLRAAVGDLLPEQLLRRRKSPYPKTCSPEYTEIIVRRTRELLADGDAPLWQAVDPGTVAKLAASGLSPAATPWFGQLMAGPQLLAYLLQFDGWMRRRNVELAL